MKLVSEDIIAYSEKFSSKESELLKELNRQTHLRFLLPQMLSGHLQGRLLSMISQMIRPKKVLELGTFTGYSTICMAEGLASGGSIDTIDFNPEVEEIGREFFVKAGLQNSVNQHIGRIREVLENLQGPFDMVFLDADKVNYGEYFDSVLPKMSPGGWIVADNLLWSGKVLEENKDEEAAALAAFADKISKDERVAQVLLPIRDGIMLIRVLA